MSYIFSDLKQYLFEQNFIQVVLLTLIIVIYTIQKLKAYRNVPPGPWGIPIFGYLPFFKNEKPEFFVKLGEKYGDLYSFQLGSRFVVILNSHDMIKNAFVKSHVFDGRPQGGIENKFFGESVLTADGETWRTQRRFLLSTFREFGLGKSEMEQFIQDEAAHAVQQLTKTKGETIDISKITNIVSCNTMSFLMFRRRFTNEDQDVVNAINSISSVNDNFDITSIFNSFPKMYQYVPDIVTGLKEAYSSLLKITRFTTNIIEEHKKAYDSNNLHDLVDVYIKKMLKIENKDDKIFNNDAIGMSIAMLFMVSIHTTQNSMSWMFRILAGHPQVQKKVQEELDQVIGRERYPSVHDRPALPYTEAVFLECYRCVSLVPFSLFHRVTEETMLNGYRLPKDTCVLSNIRAVHYSPKLWDKPEEFNPERFLDRNGNISSRMAENVIPFSIGKRNCLGEPIARMEIFVFVTSLLQNFVFKLPEDEIWEFKPDKFLPSTTCKNYFIRATPRI